MRSAIVLLGINDIVRPVSAEEPGCGLPPVVAAARIIEGHGATIRAEGVKVIGATLLPFKGHPTNNAGVKNKSTTMSRTRGAGHRRRPGPY